MSGLDPSTAHVRIIAKGYQHLKTGEFELRGGEITDLGVLELEKGVTLGITVVTGDQGVLVSNAGIKVRDQDGTNEPTISEEGAQTDEYGTCTVEGIARGTAYIAVSHKDYTDKTFQVEILETDAQDVTLKVRKPASFSGTVVSAADGLPAVGASIVLHKMIRESTWFTSFDDPQAKTDRLGEFSIEKVPVGRYRVEVTCEGFADYSTEVAVDYGTGPQTFRLSKGGTLIVSVRNKAGDPMQAYEVNARGHRIGSGEGRTDENGECVIPNLMAGTFNVSVSRSRENSIARKSEVEVFDGKTSRVDFVVNPSYSVSGKVIRDGKPARGLRVLLTLRSFEGESFPGAGGPISEAVVETGADGRFRFQHIEQGRYDLDVEELSPGKHERFHSRIIEVEDHDQDISIVLSSTSISGTVRDARGDPVAGAEITLYKSEPLEQGTLSFDGKNETSRTFRWGVKSDDEG